MNKSMQNIVGLAKVRIAELMRSPSQGRVTIALSNLAHGVIQSEVFLALEKKGLIAWKNGFSLTPEGRKTLDKVLELAK